MQLTEMTIRGVRGRQPARTLLFLSMLASAVVLIVLGSRLSFLLDDWVYILYRRGFRADAFLQPQSEHLVAGPVAIWKLLLATVGMSSTIPFRVVSTAIFLLGAWFLFVWMRRRIGEWPALLATIPILFLGAAFDDFLWFASITFLGAMTCGLGMLLALDRRDAVGDRLACAWLTGSLLFSGLWLPFAIGATVDIGLRRRERDWKRRAYIVAVPVVLYVIWWLGWGHTAENAFSLRNVASTPLFVLNSFAAAIGAYFGLATPVEGAVAPSGLDWGQPLAVLLGALALWRAYRLERIPRSLWVVLAIGLSFWVLDAFLVKSGRVPWASRYQYPGAAFVLLVAVELLRGARLGRRLIAPAVVIVAAAVASNGLFLWDSYRSYHQTSQIERADLAAVEIARDTVEPGLVLSEEIADTAYVSVDAGSYLSARDAFGSPAFSEGELADAPEVARTPADKVLAAALRIGLAPAPRPSAPAAPAPSLLGPPGAAVRRSRACLTVRTQVGKPTILGLPSGGALLEGRGAASITARLGRFSQSFPVELGELPNGERQALSIPPDRSTRSWLLFLEGAGAVRACGLGG